MDTLELFSSDTLRLVLMFFVPGFISMKVYDLLVPSFRRDFSKAFLEAVSFSCVNYALLYWVIRWVREDASFQNSPGLYHVATIAVLFVAPIVWAILIAQLPSIAFIRNWIVHPMPKPWDFVFSQRERYWVIIHLKDGRKIGGRYSWKSFTSSFPAEEQIYIEEVWQLDEQGKFVNIVERTKGLLISNSEYEAIELFEH